METRWGFEKYFPICNSWCDQDPQQPRLVELEAAVSVYRSTRDEGLVLIHTNPQHNLSGIYGNVDRLLRAPANVFLKSPKADDNTAIFKISF